MRHINRHILLCSCSSKHIHLSHHTVFHSFFLSPRLDYQTVVLNPSAGLEAVPGICPGINARGLISGTDTVPFAFLSSAFPQSDFDYSKPFCVAVTASTDPSNTGPLFIIQSGGLDSMMSSLTITSSGITFIWGNESTTFTGAQYADGNFQQFQLCVSANRITLYSGPNCAETSSVLFTQTGPDFSTGLISIVRQLDPSVESYNVSLFSLICACCDILHIPLIKHCEQFKLH